MSNNNNEKNIVKGQVTEALPNTMFRVQLEPADGAEQGEEIVAYMAGRMKLYRIKVLVGDTVEVLLDPYGGKGRVVKRI